MSTTRRIFLSAPAALALLLACAWPAARAQSCKQPAWPQWDRFAQRHLQADGRIVDFSVPARQSTSEGQSYGMFFALVANDRERFANLWRWSRGNLGAGGDRLPAWQWGKRENSDAYGVLDPNSASDADLWMAYALLEAGRLWDMPEYGKAGRALLAQIKEKEIADLPQLGLMLLPGPEGFADGNAWRLNPSYLPLPLLRGLARIDASGPWNALIATSQRMIAQASPQGFAPDWAVYRAERGFAPDPQTRGIGSYDAIRVYLWAGMADDSDPLAQAWRNSVPGMARYLASNAAPPEKADAVSGETADTGPIGFSAALLPYLQSMKLDGAFKDQLNRVREEWERGADMGYYNSVLMLFGWGWQQGQFRFGVDGELKPAWGACKK